MNKDLYSAIFKRKSFHVFKNVGEEKLNNQDLENIYNAWSNFESLYPEIKTKIRIVKSEELTLRKDAEYFILLYSEEKDNYLMNMGYLGEQLDLYLISNNIGSLWYGMGKTDQKEYEGLKYVIMFGIHKVSDQSLYRQDMYKSKRKELSQIWKGDTLGIGEIVRFAPSAVNSQPWLVENKDGVLEVKRYKKQSIIGLLTPKAAFHLNRLDIGIFMCFLELCLVNKGIEYNRELFIDDKDVEYATVAKYKLK